MRLPLPLAAWFERSPWLIQCAYFLNGVLLMLAFAPFGYYLLTFVLLIPVLYAFLSLRPRAAARVGFSFGAGLFLAGTYWLYTSIHVFGQAPLLLALFIMLCLVLIMALYYAATGWLVAKYRGSQLWQFLLLAPTVWVFVEWWRGWFLSGFPWMTMGYSQIDSALAGTAPVVGIYGVSLAVLLSTTAILAAALARGKERLLYALVALGPWVVGSVLREIEWTDVDGPAIRTTIVQGGIAQDQKWLTTQRQPTLDLYRKSLREHATSGLIIWPEVAIPSVIDQVEDYVVDLESKLAMSGQTLLFGILERDLAKQRVFNSVLAIDGVDRQIYKKRHLVPFGEYFPVPDFVREWMKLMNLPYSDISPGDDVQPLIKMADGNQLSVAICYEDAYASEQLYAMPDASILINVSNDAWFGDSIAPHQHLQIARMRALEVGRYVVRATNNGVSAFIGPYGQLLAQGPQFEYLAMTRDVQPRTGRTPFSRLGNWPIVSLALLIMLLSGWLSGASFPKYSINK